MHLETQQHGAVTVVRPDGPLTSEDAEAFLGEVGRHMRESFGRCVVDAAEVAYVDSRGLEVLVEVTDALNQNGQALKLCNPTGTLTEVLRLTGLMPKFETFEEVGAAVRSFL